MNESTNPIRNAGFRMTGPRKAVFAAITNSPLSASEISQHLKQNDIPHDLATIYRNLELLVRLLLVSKVKFDDNVTRYERADMGHHHHIICDICGKVEDIPLNEDTLLASAISQTTFQIKRHSLEFFGLCKKCQL